MPALISILIQAGLINQNLDVNSSLCEPKTGTVKRNEANQVIEGMHIGRQCYI